MFGSREVSGELVSGFGGAVTEITVESSKFSGLLLAALLSLRPNPWLPLHVISHGGSNLSSTRKERTGGKQG